MAYLYSQNTFNNTNAHTIRMYPYRDHNKNVPSSRCTRETEDANPSDNDNVYELTDAWLALG